MESGRQQRSSTIPSTENALAVLQATTISRAELSGQATILLRGSISTTDT